MLTALDTLFIAIATAIPGLALALVSLIRASSHERRCARMRGRLTHVEANQVTWQAAWQQGYATGFGDGRKAMSEGLPPRQDPAV